ncbi:MAG: hypothetical protein HOH33_03215 [Verrucomicrobia bacterium]|jgi:hypothetical protein|nr:hypothetical protein [Verrucomicrobiota bacterium]
MNPSKDLAADFLELIATLDRPGLGPAVRSSVDKPSELNAKVRNWSNAQHLDAELIDLLRSAALLWHDHLDASHSISQSIPSATGSFLHGIMHRREPDYGNSKYWFHRVGDHSAYEGIAKELQLMSDNQTMSDRACALIDSGNWDAFGFVDAVSHELSKGQDQEEFEELKHIQQIEFECLVRSFFK